MVCDFSHSVGNRLWRANEMISVSVTTMTIIEQTTFLHLFNSKISFESNFFFAACQLLESIVFFCFRFFHSCHTVRTECAGELAHSNTGFNCIIFLFNTWKSCKWTLLIQNESNIQREIRLPSPIICGSFFSWQRTILSNI